MRLGLQAAAAAVVLAMTTAAPAQVTQFELLGNGGVGLSPASENPAILPPAPGGTARGGELGTGISFNAATNALTILVGWGSGNGFVGGDLSGTVTLGHIHGPTVAPPPGAFNENIGVLITLHTLPGFNNSPSSGGFNGTVTLPAANVPHLFNGQLYLNFHTAANGPGEIRGYMIPVPEPGSLTLVGLAVGGLAWRRFRTKG